MSRTILIVTDHPERSSILHNIISRKYAAEMLDFGTLDREWVLPDDTSMVVLNLRLVDKKVRDFLSRVFDAAASRPAVLSIAEGNFKDETLSARAIGVSNVLPPTLDFGALNDTIAKQLEAHVSGQWSDQHGEVYPALSQVLEINDLVRDALGNGGPLPKESIDECCDTVVDALSAAGGISEWFDALKMHHSYTHRHLMTVCGLAVAFGLHFDMSRKELMTLAVSGLMHDIGKAKIPLALLDKPGSLSDKERLEMEKHVEYSHEILSEDGRFEEEVLDVARHHHEFLDGSGYPDGLIDDQISNLVRVMTIVDVYSALVDRRSYKEEMTPEEAYEALLAMDGKLDMDFVKAFKPIALAG